jgi:hypothetical protein
MPSGSGTLTGGSGNPSEARRSSCHVAARYCTGRSCSRCYGRLELVRELGRLGSPRRAGLQRGVSLGVVGQPTEARRATSPGSTQAGPRRLLANGLAAMVLGWLRWSTPDPDASAHRLARMHSERRRRSTARSPLDCTSSGPLEPSCGPATRPQSRRVTKSRGARQAARVTRACHRPPREHRLVGTSAHTPSHWG